MTEHTQGSWRVITDGNGHLMGVGSVFFDHHHADICLLPIFPCDNNVRLANAQLISASPDLLDACKAILARLDFEAQEHGDYAVFLGNAFRPILRAAIAKATGREG